MTDTLELTACPRCENTDPLPAVSVVAPVPICAPCSLGEGIRAAIGHVQAPTAFWPLRSSY